MSADWEPTHVLLRRLRWALQRPLASRLNGDERSKFTGPGVDFARLRQYQPGDDVRRIDWKATARSDRVFIREAEVDRAVDVWLVVDVSPSVDWGTAECLKRGRAVELAAAAGQVLGRHGNRLGLLLFAEQPVSLVPPGSGRAHLERVVAQLRLAPRSPSRGSTDLAAPLRSIDGLARRPSLIVLVSDFLMPQGWTLVLTKLARRHEIVAARLSDPREMSLPDVGIITLEDPETGEQLTVDTGDAGLRARFAAAAAVQAERIDAQLTACGVDHLRVDTDAPLIPALAAFLDARRTAGRHRARHLSMRGVGVAA
jgi:uncharacterized protein (DUF58 family)